VVCVTISSCVRVSNSATSNAPQAPSRVLMPASTLSLRDACRSRFRPVAPLER
jgi:hypothetical protein